MAITENVPVPTSYRRLHEKKLMNIPVRLLFVWGIAVIFTGYTSIILYYAGARNMMFYLVPAIIFGGMAFAIAKDVHTLDKSKLHLILIYRMLRKKQVVKKYVEPLDDLKKVFPIESVEDSGLIRFTDSHSGAIIMLDPPRIPEDDLTRHSIRMRNVINSLYGQFTFQFITTSIQDSSNPLSHAAIEAMKAKDNSQQVNNHLNSIYVESLQQSNVIHWRFILLLTIPHTKTIEEAEKFKQAFLSGLSKELGRAEVFCRLVEDRNEVIRIMRDCIC